MVPHALFVSSDRHVDVALNVLTLFVGGALFATLAYLTLTWARPPLTQADRGDVGPPVWAVMSDALRAVPKADFDFRLPSSPSIYRCEYRGHVTYSDRPCPTGRGRTQTLRPF
jgi:hypothetical protein